MPKHLKNYPKAPVYKSAQVVFLFPCSFPRSCFITLKSNTGLKKNIYMRFKFIARSVHMTAVAANTMCQYYNIVFGSE